MIKVLLIDDSTELLELFVLLLDTDKYQVETASSRDKGLDKLSTFKPDIILLDVLLEGENSRGFCFEIKQQISYKYTPIILLSADPELLKDHEDCHAFDVIEKPFNMKTVTQKIDAALLHSSIYSCIGRIRNLNSVEGADENGDGIFFHPADKALPVFDENLRIKR